MNIQYPHNKSKNREELNRRIHNYITDVYGVDFDLYKECRRIAKQANATKGNRKGDNRLSNIGEKYMRHQPLNEQDAESKFQRFKINLGFTEQEINILKKQIQGKLEYIVFRHNYSQMSPEMREQHFGKEHEAPVNNGRQELGKICAVFALADLSGDPSEVKDIKSYFYKRWKNYKRPVEGWCDCNKKGVPHRRLVTYNQLWKIGKDKTGTVRRDNPIKKRKRKKVTNVNLQHTRTRAIEVEENEVMVDIPLK